MCASAAILLILSGLVAGASSVFGEDLVAGHVVALLAAMELGVLLWFGGLTAWLSRSSSSRAMNTVRRHIDALAGALLLAFALYLLVATLVL